MDLWEEAFSQSLYHINWAPNAHSNKSPCELEIGREPNIDKLRRFGCSAFVHVPEELRTKLKNDLSN